MVWPLIRDCHVPSSTVGICSTAQKYNVFLIHHIYLFIFVLVSLLCVHICVGGIVSKFHHKNVEGRGMLLAFSMWDPEHKHRSSDLVMHSFLANTSCWSSFNSKTKKIKWQSQLYSLYIYTNIILYLLTSVNVFKK